jgi:hypothetical protein
MRSRLLDLSRSCRILLYKTRRSSQNPAGSVGWGVLVSSRQPSTLLACALGQISMPLLLFVLPSPLLPLPSMLFSCTIASLPPLSPPACGLTPRLQRRPSHCRWGG